MSVIMPAYDSGAYISKSIESVMSQTHQNWTLLVSDDGSGDDTIEIVKEYIRQDDRIQLIESDQKKTGAARTRNRAIAKVNSDYVAFLDSDDLWTPHKLERQIQFMQEKDIAFSCTQYSVIDEQGNELVFLSEGKDIITYKDLLKHHGKIGCLTVVYDRNKLGDIQMPDIRKRQDYAMWLKILGMGHKCYRLNENLGLYRVRKDSLSRNKFSAACYVWKVYRDVEDLGIFKSAYYFLFYAFFHVRKIIKSKI